MKKSPVCNKVSCYLLNMGSIYLFSLYHYTVIFLCSILLLLISSFKFLLRLKAVTASFWKISLNALFICKMFQCLWKTLLIYSRDWLYVNTTGIFVSLEVVLSLSFKSSFLPIFSTASICLFLAVVGNLDWQTSELLTIVTEVIWCSADAFDSKRLTIWNTIF